MKNWKVAEPVSGFHACSFDPAIRSVRVRRASPAYWLHGLAVLLLPLWRMPLEREAMDWAGFPFWALAYGLYFGVLWASMLGAATLGDKLSRGNTRWWPGAALIVLALILSLWAFPAVAERLPHVGWRIRAIGSAWI